MIGWVLLIYAIVSACAVYVIRPWEDNPEDTIAQIGSTIVCFILGGAMACVATYWYIRDDIKDFLEKDNNDRSE